MANAEKLEAVMTAIHDNPEKHRQGDWYAETDCGTTMCFAGWAAHLEGAELVLFQNHGYGVHCIPAGGTVKVSIAEYAKEVLDLNDSEADHIFYCMTEDKDKLHRRVKEVINGEVVPYDWEV